MRICAEIVTLIIMDRQHSNVDVNTIDKALKCSIRH